MNYPEKRTYADPVIRTYNRDLKKRWCIEFYVDIGSELKRFRFSNGKPLGRFNSPNSIMNFRGRLEAFTDLRYAYQQALDAGWLPGDQPITASSIPTATESFTIAYENMVKRQYSELYLRDLRTVKEQVLNWLRAMHSSYIKLFQLKPSDFEHFLEPFQETRTTHNNKRRVLSALIAECIRVGHLDHNPIRRVKQLKVVEHRNRAYTTEQVKAVLAYLKDFNKDLWLVGVLTYGTLLRPHQEIRKLTSSDISPDGRTIFLNGHISKNKHIRFLQVTPQVQNVLVDWGIAEMEMDVNIFTRTVDPPTPDYFKTLWTKAKQGLLEKGIIHKDQTLYSLRHAAAIEIFRKTNSVEILMQVMGHSNPLVTTKYLRSLQAGKVDIAKEFLPEF